VSNEIRGSGKDQEGNSCGLLKVQYKKKLNDKKNIKYLDHDGWCSS
jgi:hypothetical protein